MSVMVVRQQVKDGSVEEAEERVRDLFATLDRVRPEGVRYASTRVVDSSTFVILLELADGIEDPRPGIPEYLGFLAQLKGAGCTDRRLPAHRRAVGRPSLPRRRSWRHDRQHSRARRLTSTTRGPAPIVSALWLFAPPRRRSQRMPFPP
jgi:hypothetical protein